MKQMWKEKQKYGSLKGQTGRGKGKQIKNTEMRQ